MSKNNPPHDNSFARGTIRVCRWQENPSIVMVALSRPESYNALNDDTYEDLIDVMHWIAKDSTCSAMVMTGTGSYFSSGADLKHAQNNNDDDDALAPTPGGRNTRERPSGRFMMTVLEFPKLLGAAVNGPAVGIGCTLLLHCDLVFCSDDPKLYLWAPFTRLALVPEFCSSVTFVETMGLAKANEMLLLGKKINAQQAYDWNICSRIIPKSTTTTTTNDTDPFHDPHSIVNQMCREIHQRLLSSLKLPLGHETMEYFISLVRNNHERRERLKRICRIELERLDERFDTGQVQRAAQHLRIGSTTKSPSSSSNRSKL
jgi:peroxisomal 3,2-trans-enoyl-CoA isomerase